MAERNLHVDHVTIWRWVQCYAPELNRRCRQELRTTKRVVEGRRDVLAGSGQVDLFISRRGFGGCHIDFPLSARRDAAAANLQKALRSPGHPRPRVINVDGNPSYPKVISELKKSGELGRRCRCRPVRYLSNIVEQDHRAIKRRVHGSQGFRSFQSVSDPRHQDDAHDPEGTGKVVGQGRHRKPGRVYFSNTRSRYCCLTQADQRPPFS